jgi:hypothetical protein
MRKLPCNSRCSLNISQLRTSLEAKSGTAFLIAAYASFFAWLAHSFAVRAFVDSLHLLSKFVKR